MSILTLGFKTKNDDRLIADGRIYRVLARLDTGEHLIHRRLKCGNNFCILGLFADESGIVKWEGDKYKRRRHNYTNILDLEVVNLFKLKDPIGSFDIETAPESIKRLLAEHFDLATVDSNRFSLTTINDSLIALDKRNVLNSVLAQVIRSGVVFKDYQGVEYDHANCN